MLTFKNTVDQIQELIKRQGGTAYETKIKNWVNHSYRRLYDRFIWRDAVEFDLAVTTVVGQAEYILSKDVSKVIQITDRVNDRVLDGMNGPILNDRFVSTIDVQGQVDGWAPVGVTQYSTQMSTSDTLAVVSSDADDTATVTINGKVAGERDFETITLTGTTAVTTTKTFQSIESIAKSAVTEGIVDITETIATTSVCKLAPGEKVSYYQVIRFVRVPGTIATLYMTHKKAFRLMVNDNDTPMFDCTNVLIRMGYAMSLRESGNNDLAIFEEQATDAMITRLQGESNRDGTTHYARPLIKKLDIETAIY